jgi:hypothetical protein
MWLRLFTVLGPLLASHSYNCPEKFLLDYTFIRLQFEKRISRISQDYCLGLDALLLLARNYW